MFLYCIYYLEFYTTFIISSGIGVEHSLIPSYRLVNGITFFICETKIILNIMAVTTFCDSLYVT